MRPFGVLPDKPTAAPPVDKPNVVDAGVQIVVKRIVADFAARGLGEPSREEIHTIALACTTASTGSAACRYRDGHRTPGGIEMSELRYTVDDARLREVLEAEIAKNGTQTALAKKLGVSLVYLNDVVRGRRSISALAPRLGFHTLTVHLPDDGTPPIIATDAARLIDGLRRRQLSFSFSTEPRDRKRDDSEGDA